MGRAADKRERRDEAQRARGLKPRPTMGQRRNRPEPVSRATTVTERANEDEVVMTARGVLLPTAAIAGARLRNLRRHTTLRSRLRMPGWRPG